MDRRQREKKRREWKKERKKERKKDDRYLYLRKSSRLLWRRVAARRLSASRRGRATTKSYDYTIPDTMSDHYQIDSTLVSSSFPFFKFIVSTFSSVSCTCPVFWHYDRVVEWKFRFIFFFFFFFSEFVSVWSADLSELYRGRRSRQIWRRTTCVWYNKNTQNMLIVMFSKSLYAISIFLFTLAK
mgnify:CR=1 FL=1